MSNIPKARELLHDLADALQSSDPPDPYDAGRTLRTITNTLLTREKPTRKAPVKNREMTAKLAREIRAHAKGHPKASHQQIANVFNVNPGRVSEALARKW